MHLHHFQGVLTLYFAKVTKLLKLQLNKICRLKCSRDHCCMIKYNLLNVKNYNVELVWQYMCVALTVKHNYFIG